MKSIDELKKYDVKDISVKTKIVQQRIRDILECNFDKLDKTRARGFIHILSREYKIDFDDWIDAYDNFHKERAKNSQSVDENNDINVDKKDQITTIVVDSTMKDKTYVRLIVVLIILVIMFVVYFVYKNILHDNISDNISSNINGNTHLLSDVQSGSNGNIDISDDPVNNDFSSDNLEIIDNNDSRVVDSKDIIDVETKNDDSKDIESKGKDESLKSSNTNIVDELIITPKSALWVGIIDLDTYQKRQLSITSDYKIILDKDKLIRTGHSYFDIKGPNSALKKYIGGNNRYFLYTMDSGLKEIKKEDFLNFNRGEEW